jgi:DNA-3-methyladenine glycosylase II
MNFQPRPQGGKMTIIRNDDDVREGLEALAEIDPRLVPVIEAAGTVPLRLAEPGFAGLAFIVVSQVISKASAAAIWRRMSEAGPLTAENYLRHSEDIVAGFGLSRAKAATLLRLAQAVSEGQVDLDRLAVLEPSNAMAELTALPGIGSWTAEVYLMFCGGHPDIFPSGDVALQAAVATAFQLDRRPTPRELTTLAEVWRPWRSVAARLFWAYYAASQRRDVVPVMS